MNTIANVQVTKITVKSTLSLPKEGEGVVIGVGRELGKELGKKLGKELGIRPFGTGKELGIRPRRGEGVGKELGKKVGKELGKKVGKGLDDGDSGMGFKQTFTFGG